MSARKNGHIYKHGRTFWIKYSRNGRPYRENSHSEKESDARRLLNKRLGEIATSRFTNPAADKVTIRELAADYLTDYRTNALKSLDKAERFARGATPGPGVKDSPLMAFFGDYQAHSVGADMVKKYVALRLEHGLENSTINRELAALKRMFSLGIEAEKIYRKPHIGMLKESNVRKGFFEYPEFVSVRDACPDYFKPVVTFAYYTGWRKEEILSLRWNQVDLQSEEVRLNSGETKNDDGRVIMLDGELLETIQAQWERRKVAEIPGHSPTLLCQFVFHRGGKKIGANSGDIRDVWQNACIAAGVGQMVEVERKGKMVKVYQGKLFHDFRRSACRDMIRAGIPERVAMRISGHKTRSVFDRYNIVSPNDLKEAARKRSEHTQAQEARAKKVVAIKQG